MRTASLGKLVSLIWGYLSFFAVELDAVLVKRHRFPYIVIITLRPAYHIHTYTPMDVSGAMWGSS